MDYSMIVTGMDATGKQTRRSVTALYAPSAPLILGAVAAVQTLQTAHLAERGDPLARRQRDVPAGAVALAEAALDARVDQRRRHRRWLQVLQVHMRVLRAHNIAVSASQHAG